MKYNKLESKNHIVSQKYPCCIKDFNQIILDEDDNLVSIPCFFNDVDVIDLDCVERRKALIEKRNRVRTMDTAFAISDSSSLEVLLVELRFNYRNLSNLDRITLIEKVNGSISILGNSIKINDTYVFIFQSNLVQQATNRLQRMVPVIPSNYSAMDINQLISEYF